MHTLHEIREHVNRVSPGCFRALCATDSSTNTARSNTNTSRISFHVASEHSPFSFVTVKHALCIFVVSSSAMHTIQSLLGAQSMLQLSIPSPANCFMVSFIGIIVKFDNITMVHSDFEHQYDALTSSQSSQIFVGCRSLVWRLHFSMNSIILLNPYFI